MARPSQYDHGADVLTHPTIDDATDYRSHCRATSGRQAPGIQSASRAGGIWE